MGIDNVLYDWINCDSLSDFESRLERMHQARVLQPIITEDANCWGFVKLRDDLLTTIPVGYVSLGLIPKVIKIENLLLLGICEVVVGISLISNSPTFRYRMPTIFHSFVRVDESGILIQDEIGFVLLTLRGTELWKFCNDIIKDYKLMGNELVVTTFEDKCVRLKIGAS